MFSQPHPNALSLQLPVLTSDDIDRLLDTLPEA